MPSVATDLWNEMMNEDHTNSRHGKGANRAFTAKSGAKVDRQGEYLPLPNITCVCHVDQKGLPALRFLPAEINRVAGQYLNPLPSSSYHVTLSAGPLQHQYKGRWEDVLQDDCWEAVADFLCCVAHAPCELVIGSIVLKSSGGLTAYLCPAEHIRDTKACGQAGNVKYKGNSKELCTREELRKLSGGMFEPQDRPWHITLAYPRAAAGAMPMSVRDEVIHLVKDAFQISEEMISPPTLCFQDAVLCLSPDMTRFQEWDGKPPASGAGATSFRGK
mmetsp:Transcript_24985/g.73083  ORF Transcript_24985/g.73083 Transcript_24985/m.73083 type:complete len:274 (-) Transcript_24985:106-927(-)|eukprot:CAMPEP_0113544112 /NCGR_PEP_ID=MMETSP0015_2-20120614/10531_1 /TAXON_ID=2838 /ORGANISM="Odontella" /LENGTH=273 /DNA_ID=CAMNT_0000444343 /DNA_START=178 /DNA_END=999 /DNA_ORIENTATION=- /assembly_acc=CAM_ASM_000160